MPHTVPTESATTNRRTVLKNLVAGAGGAVALSTSAAASPSEDLVGVAYDTLTHQAASSVTGHVADADGRPRGTLDVAGFSIPVEALEEVEAPAGERRFNGLLDDRRFVRDDQPLKVNFLAHGDSYSGTVTRPDGRFGMFGFKLFPAETGVDPERLAERRQPDERWMEAPASFEIPDTGVPTDTGPRRLARVATEQGGDR